MKRFEAPVTLTTSGGPVRVATVADALSLLQDVDWPVRGPRHRDAVDTCLKAEDGHRVAADARRALVEAADEAGLAVKG